jgi:hypothetical protein
MWLFTKYGFYSAVCARQGDGSHGQPVDPNRIMVRARMRQHLEALKERFNDLVSNPFSTACSTSWVMSLIVVVVPGVFG